MADPRSYSVPRFIERMCAGGSALSPTDPLWLAANGPYGDVFTRMVADECAREPLATARAIDALISENDTLRAQLATERATWAPDTRTVRRCADVLAAFYRAPLSMSSVQPLLALAEELNPSLKGHQ